MTKKASKNDTFLLAKSWV